MRAHPREMSLFLLAALGLLLGFAVLGSVIPAAQAQGAPDALIARADRQPLNDAILRVLQSYHNDSAHPYVWARGVDTDGVTQELRWRGTLLAAPEPDGGIHCSGITYEVYIRALSLVVGDALGPPPTTLLALKDPWYVRTDKDLGPVGALVDAGLGLEIDRIEDLQPGDLVQFWRNSGKGHSAVFIRHTRNRDGSVRGIVYWSAQGVSEGVGMRIISPGPDINQIAPGRLHGVRALW